MQPTKIAYLPGEPDLKSKAKAGTIQFFDEELLLAVDSAVTIPFSRIDDVTFRRINGLGSMIQIKVAEEIHSLLVPRINIGGAFLVIDALGTQKLLGRIQTAWRGAIR